MHTGSHASLCRACQVLSGTNHAFKHAIPFRTGERSILEFIWNVILRMLVLVQHRPCHAADSACNLRCCPDTCTRVGAQSACVAVCGASRGPGQRQPPGGGSGPGGAAAAPEAADGGAVHPPPRRAPQRPPGRATWCAAQPCTSRVDTWLPHSALLPSPRPCFRKLGIVPMMLAVVAFEGSEQSSSHSILLGLGPHHAQQG